MYCSLRRVKIETVLKLNTTSSQLRLIYWIWILELKYDLKTMDSHVLISLNISKLVNEKTRQVSFGILSPDVKQAFGITVMNLTPA